MIFRAKIAFCLLLVGLLTSNKLFSQEKEKKITEKNLVEVSLPFYNFLDESRPVFQYAIRKDGRRGVGIAIGIGYTRLISDKGLNVRAALNFFSFYYPSLYQQQRVPPGAISKRSASLYSLGISFPVASFSFGDFKIIADAIHRRGSESMILSYNGGETRSKSYEMKDWGLSSGIQFSKNLSKRFVFSAEASASYFVYRYNRGRAASTIDNGSSKAMLTLSFGLGYRF